MESSLRLSEIVPLTDFSSSLGPDQQDPQSGGVSDPRGPKGGGDPHPHSARVPDGLLAVPAPQAVVIRKGPCSGAGA